MSVDEAAMLPAATNFDRRPAAWDADRSPGSLLVAWQNPDSRLISPVGLLEHGGEAGYRFRYLRRAPDVAGFRPFLSFPDWQRTYSSRHLFPLFSQRIMSPRRPDFGQFLRQLNLSEGATPWEQLARSEGRRTGDTVQVFPIPAVQPDRSTTCRFLVHGIRHVTGGLFPKLDIGEELALQADPANEVNPEAVLVCDRKGGRLGYVPDLLLDHLQALRRAGPIALTVEHLNGPETPAHLRLLARLDGRAPLGYEPMTCPKWETF
ncbi:MAG: HIRAN domain-containing protein [Actinomycetia bacterium]|nr:HIRAN domain-containing protein [Actinomycetes bacterium]